MSVLQFIAAIKWPITVLLLASFVSWRLKRHPDMLEYFKTFFERRNVKLDLVGQKIELIDAPGAAMVTATRSDAVLADTASRTGQDVEHVRRKAIEHVVRYMVGVGYDVAKRGAMRPTPVVEWQDNGTPRIRISTGPGPGEERGTEYHYGGGRWPRDR